MLTVRNTKNYITLNNIEHVYFLGICNKFFLYRMYSKTIADFLSSTDSWKNSFRLFSVETC